MEGGGMTNPVKWIGDDGGWKVGQVVRPGFQTAVHIEDAVKGNNAIIRWKLIQHAHTRELEWVESSKLTDYVVTPEFK
jgi:hypothetical protein